MNLLRLNKQFAIRPLTDSDITDRYLEWMRDPEVTRFLDAGLTIQTKNSIRDYVRTFDNKKRYLWGIFTVNSSIHIGNISLYNIHPHHRFGHYGYLIGDREYWGSGAATQAIALVFDFAFNDLKLNSISGAANEENVPSIFNFQKLGLTYCGTTNERLFYDGKFSNEVMYSITNGDWQKIRSRFQPS